MISFRLHLGWTRIALKSRAIMSIFSKFVIKLLSKLLLEQRRRRRMQTKCIHK